VCTEVDDFMLDVECSAGFYVRALAHDLGQRLGIGAHLAGLRRTVSAGLTLDESIPLEFAERSREDAQAAVISIDRMLPHLATVTVTDEGVLRAIHGRDIGASEVIGGSIGDAGPEDLMVRLPVPVHVRVPVRVIDELGRLIAIAEPSRVPGFLHPAVVLR